jgi:hypothetical protein
MVKMKYIEPKIKISSFSRDDVITTSSPEQTATGVQGVFQAAGEKSINTTMTFDVSADLLNN